jgi:hypothetical protein
MARLLRPACGCHGTHRTVGAMAPETTRLTRLRWAVRAALALGIAASIAANVLHAEPNDIARAIAAWPPAALLLTLELIARVPVHRRALAVVRILATVTIGGIAAWVSYWHMVAVAQRYGETGPAPYLIPLSVDGLVVVASVCLVELAGRIRAAEQPAGEHPVEAANPAAEPPASAAETPGDLGTAAEAADACEIVPPVPVDDRAARKAAAMVALAGPEPDPAAIAAEARVSVGTLQRWVDEAAKAARRPRGGPRKPAPEGDQRGMGRPNPSAEATGAAGSGGVREDRRRQDVRSDEGLGTVHGDGPELGAGRGGQGRHDRGEEEEEVVEVAA